MYIAILDEVPDKMAITLALHTILNADAEFTEQDTDKWRDMDYLDWRENSYRKVTIRVNRKEFEKIKSASLEELKAVLNEVDSKNIFDYFRKEENG